MSSAGRSELPAGGITQVGRGARLDGTLRGPGVLLVHGTLCGTLDLEGDVIVGETGALERILGKAASLRVEGRVEGDFRVEGTLQIATGGSVGGAAQARRLETSPGSSLEAQLVIQTSVPPESPAKD